MKAVREASENFVADGALRRANGFVAKAGTDEVDEIAALGGSVAQAGYIDRDEVH